MIHRRYHPVVENEIKYEGYIQRENQSVKRFKQMEGKRIPPDFDYGPIPGLSRESLEKLNNIKPLSIGQASRISGITPAAIAILLVALSKHERREGRNISGTRRASTG
jgi:tRNA uridine 5-carboxymethylaminomethyl modification enzyme